MVFQQDLRRDWQINFNLFYNLANKLFKRVFYSNSVYNQYFNKWVVSEMKILDENTPMTECCFVVVIYPKTGHLLPIISLQNLIPFGMKPTLQLPE